MPRFSVEPSESVTYRVDYEDAHLLIVSKPPGLPTQPGKGHAAGTLLNGLFARHGPRLQNLGASRDFGLLHRLDRFASGLLIVALTPEAYDRLREAFGAREVKKLYWAVTRGRPNKPSGVIDRPILEETSDLKRARLSPRGKPAITAYRTLDATEEAALLECRTVTGRLHQVRVHLASIHCPIFGDDIYAPQAVAKACRRLALHAHRIALRHPMTGEAIDVRSPWPSDLRSLLRKLRLRNPSVDGGHEFARDGVGEQDAGVGEDPSPVLDANEPTSER